jgi:hypothetical protein
MQQPHTPVDGVTAVGPATTGAGQAPARRGGPSGRTVLFTLLAAAVAGILAGALIAFVGKNGSGDKASETPPAATASSVEISPKSVSSFDPSGGSGFRDEGGGLWSTQTYKTAQFGKLKPGVGLLLDLGEARAVSDVTIPKATGGLKVQLMAGDEAPSGSVDGMTGVDDATTGDGATSLSGAKGGQHRYWLVWVTELAPSGDGFAAEMQTPVVKGPAS